MRRSRSSKTGEGQGNKEKGAYGRKPQQQTDGYKRERQQRTDGYRQQPMDGYRQEKQPQEVTAGLHSRSKSSESLIDGLMALSVAPNEN